MAEEGSSSGKGLFGMWHPRSPKSLGHSHIVLFPEHVLWFEHTVFSADLGHSRSSAAPS